MFKISDELQAAMLSWGVSLQEMINSLEAMFMACVEGESLADVAEGICRSVTSSKNSVNGYFNNYPKTSKSKLKRMQPYKRIIPYARSNP